MKKNLLLSLAVMLIGVGFATAASKRVDLVDPVAQNDGDTRVGVSVSCLSSAWTRVVAARSNRRTLKLTSLRSNTGIVCLGTADNGAVTCTSTNLGIDLGTADAYQDSSEAVLYCRAGSGTQVVKGFDLYDSRD